MIYRETEEITKEERKNVFDKLLAYNLSHLEDKNPRDLGIFLEDEEGNCQGGLIGMTHGNWLDVEYLVVDEALRGQNIGSELLKRAEQAASDRGCKYVFLDTFSFQAPEFYKKMGYKEVFVREEYPVTGKRHYLLKEL